MKRRLIVPIDFGTASLAALRHANAISARGGEKIIVVHVMPAPSYGVVYGETISLSAELMFRLERFQETRARARIDAMCKAQQIADDRVEIALPRGEIDEQVLEIANRRDDLIIVGANERHLLRAGLSEKLCRRAACPILACQPEVDDAEGFEQRAIVAVDGSDLAAAVTREAAALVAPDGELELVHIADPRPVHHVATDLDGLRASPGAEAIAATAAAARGLEAWIESLDLPVRCTAVIANEPPASALIERAQATDAAFIAVGAHGKGEGEAIGLAEAMLRHSPVPVLTLSRAN